MAVQTISLEELMADWDSLGMSGPVNADAHTTTELCELTGHSPRWILKRLRRLMAKGSVKCVRKDMETADGRMVRVPAYRVVVGK